MRIFCFFLFVPEFWIIPTVIYGVRNQATYYHTTTCRQLGNGMTYNTEKKNPTSHDVADTSAVSGRRVGKTQHHVVKTNCRRHLKRRHFQLRHEATDTLYREMCLAPYLPGGMVVAIAVKSATLYYIVFNRLPSFYFITQVV